MIESFDDAMAFMRKAITDDCDQTYCAMYDADCYACEGSALDRLQKAHEHEMEQLRRSRFREGYEAGQRSMDAERYAVALRLKHLPLDEDSHGNLSQIARAVWHSDFGWTRGACEALRDELVRLLGGVHDETAPTAATCGSCDADCDCGNQQPKAVAYDVLGNERHKAVCELRSISDSYMTTGDAAQFVCDIANAINAEGCDSETIYKGLRDRLIHLLGGNTEPLPNFTEPNLPKSAEIVKPESADGGENCRITDELREWMDLVLTADDQAWDIADRIDAQFKRICWQQEAVLQHTIDTMVDERDELQRELSEQKSCAEGFAPPEWYEERVLNIEKERDELKKKLDKYERRDTAESIVRDIHLGNVTDSQAVERIRTLNG